MIQSNIKKTSPFHQKIQYHRKKSHRLVWPRHNSGCPHKIYLFFRLFNLTRPTGHEAPALLKHHSSASFISIINHSPALLAL